MFKTLYIIIRLTIIFIIVIVAFILFKKKKIRFGKKEKVLSVVLICALFLFPFENLLVEFSSPQAAFEYQQSGKIIKTIYGKESALVIYKQKDTISYSVHVKDEDRWKLASKFNQEVRFIPIENPKGEYVATLCGTDTSNEYFILLDEINVKSEISNIKVSDNQNSVFNEFFEMNKLGNYNITHYSVIYKDKGDGGYTLLIEGEEYDIDL